MTQTIHTPDGHNALWIEADHGGGRRGRARKVEWYKLTLSEYLAETCSEDWEELSIEQAEAIREDLSAFADKGYAWRAMDEDAESVIVPTPEDAKDWAYGRSC